MFDKSNRYIYFLLDFVAVGFIRLFQIFQYSDISCPSSCMKEWRIRQHISKLMNSYILHDESRSFIRGVDESCNYLTGRAMTN